MQLIQLSLNSNHKWKYILVASAVFILVLWISASQTSALVEVGYEDFTYPKNTGGNSEPTGEKPESKLWWNDGYWWGSMWSTTHNSYYIYRLNETSQVWEQTNTPLDPRMDSRADALWDGQHLYIASHIFTGSGSPAPVGQRGELFRYSYDSISDNYTLDSGFPVEVTGGESETLVLDKDSNGQLWVTYVESGKVMVNHSINGDDTNWGTPFVLPVGSAANVTSDDISSVITYKNHVGIMWSNQSSDNTMYFAVHPAGASETTWTPVTAYSVSGDDHISLKSLETDSSGNVYAAIKTSRSAALIVLLVCENNINHCTNSGNWDDYPVYTSSDHGPTRPILLIDEENRELYVFTRNKDSNNDDGIYYKTADMDNILFQSGIGVPFINLAAHNGANDPTSTKQNLTAATGLVVLASDSGSKYYLHNHMPLVSDNAPILTSFSPTSAVVGTEVTITGSKFTGATEVAFNGTPASTPTVVSDNEIRADVPSGATTGKISVTNADGTGSSVDDFIVIVPPEISSFTPTSGPVSTEVTLSGSGFQGTTNVAFNGVSAILVTVDSATQIRVNVPAAATTGPISVANPAGNDTTATDFTVTAATLYTLTVNTSGTGSVTLDPPGGVYIDGTVVTLTPSAGDGYKFSGWSGDLTGSANPAMLTMDSDKDVTAIFDIFVGGGPVAFEEVKSGGSASSASVATSANLAAVQGDLYLAAVSTKPYVTVSSMTGLGLNWSPVDAQCGGRNTTGVEVWMAQGSPTAAGPATATLSGTPVNAVIVVSRYSNVDSDNPIGDMISGNTNGVEGLCSGGTDNSAYSLPLTTSVEGAFAYGAVGLRSKTHTPGAGYTERAEIFQGSGGGTAAVAVEDKEVVNPSTVAVDGTLSNTVDWAAIGLAINPAPLSQYVLTTTTVGSGDIGLEPPGGVYTPGITVTATATADPDWEFVGWSGALSGTLNTETLVMDADKIVTATFTMTQHSLTTATVGNGSINLDPPGGVYAPGTTVTATATADPGWEFVNWSGDVTGTTNPATVTMDADKSVTATFTMTQYTLTTATLGNGSIDLEPPGGSYITGTMVTMTATADPEWEFVGWSGDITGSTNPRTIAINADKSVTATFTMTQYTLTTATVGNGSIDLEPPGGSYITGTMVTMTATAAAGWEFVNWSGDVTGTTNPRTITIDADKSVTATFTMTQYTLTTATVGNGSIELEPSAGSYITGTMVTMTATADPDWEFVGWSGDVSGRANPRTITIDADKSVTATFTMTQHSLTTATVGNGSIDLEPPGGVYAPGTTVTATATADPDWEFVGWSGDLSGTLSTETLVMDADKSVTATFTTTQYTLTTATVGSGSIDLEPPGGSYITGTMVTMTATAAAGWEFVNWSGDVSGTTNPRTITIDADKSVTATFTMTQYTLTTATVGNGSIELEPSAGSYITGTMVMMTATADLDWEFVGWSGDVSGTANPRTITIDADKSVTATFTMTQHSLTTATVGNGSIDLDPPGGVYAPGTTVTATATADPDWEFVGWSGDLSGTLSTETLVMDTDKSVTATFTTTQYNLTTATVGNGSINLEPPGGTYITGTMVTMTATAAAGWEFVNWSGDVSGTANPRTITIDADKSVTATFTMTQYSLTTATLGNGSIELEPPGGSYITGTMVTITATADPDWEFVGWSGDVSGTANPKIITIDADKSVTATFTMTQYSLTTATVGSGSIDLEPPGGSYITGTMVTMTATAAAGWEFVNWSGDVSGTTNPRTITIDANKSVTATFTMTQYTLATATVGNGSIELEPPGGTYITGTMVTMTATADPDWEFVGWSGDVSGPANPRTITIDADKSVTATFTMTQHSLTTATVGNGSIDLDPPGGVYAPGTTVTATATADPDWEFVGWSGDLSGTLSTETLVMDADKSVTATFTTTQYTLTTATVGNGSIELEPPGGTYITGTMVTMTATAAAGWEFVNWSGDVSGTTNPRTITIDADKSVTATFTTTQYTLTTATVGNGSIDLEPPGGSYITGTMVTMTATADPDWEFVGWSGNLTGSANPAVLTMDGDKNVTAIFDTIVGGGPVLFEEVKSGGSASSVSVATTTNLAAVQGDLYLAAISSKPYKTVNSVTGLGLNWTLVDAQCGGRNTTGINVWMAQGTPTAAGPVTATLSGTPVNAVIVVSRYSNVDPDNPIGNVVSGNTNGLEGVCSGGTDTSAYSLPLTTAVEGAFAYGAVGLRSKTHTPGVGYIERAEILYGKANIASEDKEVVNPSTVVVDGSFSGTVDWGAIGLAINPGSLTHQYVLMTETVGGGMISLEPPGGAYAPGTTVTVTATADPDWEFVGWSGDLSGTLSTETLLMDADKIVTATFTTTLFTLTTDTVGSGSIDLEPPGGSYITGTMVTMTATAAAGWEFVNWSGDVTGSANPMTIIIDANKNVTANFAQLPTYTLSVAVTPDGSGSVVLDPPGGSHITGTMVTMTATAAAGWEFVDWSGDITGSANPMTITIDGDKSVTATFTMTQNTLTTAVVGDGSIDLEPQGGNYITGTMVTMTATAGLDWEFVGWSGDVTGSANPTTIIMDADKSVTAMFTTTQYTLTMDTVGNGSIDLEPPGGTYITGTMVTMTATAAAGWEFVNWTGDVTGSTNPTTIIMDVDKNVTATFTQLPTYTLSVAVSPDGSGSVLLDPPGGSYITGTMVTMTATAAAGWEFVNWSGDVTGSANPMTIIIDANKNVTANFAQLPTYTLSIAVNPADSGSVLLDPPGGSYVTGTMVTMTATADPGWEFVNWSGDINGTANPATITIDADKSVTATFTMTQYTLTTATVGNGSIDLEPPGGSYITGTMVTMTATANSEWEFAGWSGDVTGSANPMTIIMDGDKTVTANFVNLAGGPVILEEIQTGGSAGSISVATDATLTGIGGDLYLAAISAKPHTTVTGVVGLGLTWTEVADQCAGRNATGVSIWMAQGPSATTGVVTATMDSAPVNAVIAVSRYSGVAAVNPIGNMVSGNTNGQGGICSGGTDGTSYSFNMNTAVNGAIVYGAVGLRSKTHTPGANYAEQAEITQGRGGGAAGLAIQDQTVATASGVVVDGSFNKKVDWAMIALEIRPG